MSTIKETENVLIRELYRIYRYYCRNISSKVVKFGVEGGTPAPSP